MIVVLLLAIGVAWYAGSNADRRDFNYTRATIAGLAVLLIASALLTGDPFAILDQVTSSGPSITEYP